MKNTRFITKKGLEKLKKELKKRVNKMRDEIANRLDEANQSGDRSENSAYTAALEEYQHNEVRIRGLKELIKSLKVAPNKRGDLKIDIGDSIKVKDLDLDTKLEYTIVGEGEGDPLSGRVSSDSVVGSAFIGKKKGEIVKIELTKGIKKYKILEIS